MADDIWGTRVAQSCIAFWMRDKFPNRAFSVHVQQRPDTMLYITAIRIFNTNDGPMIVTFVTDDRDFHLEGYHIPDETKAQLMMLLG